MVDDVVLKQVDELVYVGRTFRRDGWCTVDAGRRLYANDTVLKAPLHLSYNPYTNVGLQVNVQKIIVVVLLKGLNQNGI